MRRRAADVRQQAAEALATAQRQRADALLLRQRLTQGLVGRRMDEARRPDLARQVETLRVALDTNRVIGTAVGIVMAQFGVDRDRARSYLERISSESGTKLRDIARRLVDDTELGRAAARR